MRRFCQPLLSIAAIFWVTLISFSQFASADDRILTIYSARHSPGDAALYQLFTKNTGIKVKVVPGKPQELLQRIKLEADRGSADLFMTQDGSYLQPAVKDNLLQPIPLPDLMTLVPVNLRDAQNRWIAFSWRARAIVYDKAKVSSKYASTYEALTAAKLQGQLLMRPVTNADNQSFVAGTIGAIGADKAEIWVKGLVQNFARTPRGDDSDQLQAIVDGAGTVAVVNTNYIARFFADTTAGNQAARQRLTVTFPNQEDRGTSINISAVGVSTYAPHKENAVKFLEFLLSPEAQRLISDLNHEYPARNGIVPDAILSKWGPFKTDDPHITSLSENNLTAIQMMERVGWH